MSLHPTFRIVLQNPETPTWPEWEMSPILLPWKEQLCWRSVARLSFSPVGSRRKHLSPLLSAQIRCLYLFRVEEINPEWSTVGRGARKRWWKEGKHNEAAWFSFACVCPCEQMAFFGKPSLLSQETGALTPCYNPLPATFPASTCPPPAPIHSHYEAVCLMLSNRNNPQEMEHPMYSGFVHKGRKMAGARNKGAI